MFLGAPLAREYCLDSQHPWLHNEPYGCRALVPRNRSFTHESVTYSDGIHDVQLRVCWLAVLIAAPSLLRAILEYS